MRNDHATDTATRIALLLPDLNGGGVERTAVSLAQGFLERGLEVDLVLCRVRGPLLAEVPSAVRLVPLRPAPTMLGRLLVVAADPGGRPSWLGPCYSAGVRRAPIECCPRSRAICAGSSRRR